jgi:hypothetical protein
MPALLLVLVLVLAGCAPGWAASDGVPTADVPFTLTALDGGQSTSPLRGTSEGIRKVPNDPATSARPRARAPTASPDP